MKKAVVLIASAACAVLMCTTGAFARNNTSQNINETDKLFLKALAPSNEADIQISRMAASTTKNPQVRDLANTVLSGDVLLQSHVRHLADQTGVSLPTSIDTPDVHLKDTLKSDASNQNAFDRAYVQAMLDKFHAAVNYFRIEATQTNDPSLRTFAQANLPKLEKTLDKIESVSANLPPA